MEKEVFDYVIGNPPYQEDKIDVGCQKNMFVISF